MKNFIILILSIGILMSIFIYEDNYFKNTVNYLLTDINHIENKINNKNYEDAKEYFKFYKKSWNGIKCVWDLFVNNDEIDDIDDDISKCEIYIKNENKEESIVYLRGLKQKYNSILDRKKIKVKNVI